MPLPIEEPLAAVGYATGIALSIWIALMQIWLREKGKDLKAGTNKREKYVKNELDELRIKSKTLGSVLSVYSLIGVRASALS